MCGKSSSKLIRPCGHHGDLRYRNMARIKVMLVICSTVSDIILSTQTIMFLYNLYMHSQQLALYKRLC